MTVWNQAMIDVESMATGPDAALTAIGVALFNLQEMKIGPTLCIPVHLATSVRLGMTMDPSTVLWWLKQSQEARDGICFNLVDVRVALDMFVAFMGEHTVKKDTRTWGNSARFDLGIMETALRLAGHSEAWYWGLETCFRTVRNMNSHIPYNPSERTSTHHNAVDDCVFQIQHLFKIRRHNLEYRRVRSDPTQA